MEGNSSITILILLLGFVLKATPGASKIISYYAAIAFVLGIVFGLIIYGASLDGAMTGAVEALVATGIYEVGSNLSKGADTYGK